jgi:hypothetical protein
MKPIYQFDGYKAAIRETLESLQSQYGREYTFQAMAQAARIQRGYVSQVLRGNAHFSEDQLYLCCRFLDLSGDETEYLLLLLQIERSIVEPRRAELTQRINRLRAKYNADTTSFTRVPEVTGPSVGDEYHLNPLMLLVHMFLMVPKYAADPSKIRQHLGLESPDLQQILVYLERSKLVRKKKSGAYEVLTSTFHLKPTSPLFKSHLQLLRLRSLERVCRSSSADSLNLSATFTATRAVRDQIRAKLMDMMREAHSVIGPAPSEGVYQMNIDLFEWS